MRAFSLHERALDGDTREIRLEGELDLSVTHRFKSRLDQAVRDDVEVLVCLKDCEFIDSTGIAAIVLAHKLLADKDRALRVCHPSEGVLRILAITGLTDEGIVLDGNGSATIERLGRVSGRARGKVEAACS